MAKAYCRLSKAKRKPFRIIKFGHYDLEQSFET